MDNKIDQIQTEFLSFACLTINLSDDCDVIIEQLSILSDGEAAGMWARDPSGKLEALRRLMANKKHWYLNHEALMKEIRFNRAQHPHSHW